MGKNWEHDDYLAIAIIIVVTAIAAVSVDRNIRDNPYKSLPPELQEQMKNIPKMP